MFGCWWKMKFQVIKRFLEKLVFKISLLKLNSCFKQTKVLGQFRKLKTKKYNSITSRLFCCLKEKRGTSIFWQIWTQLPSERKWVQGVRSLRRKWDIAPVTVSRLTLWHCNTVGDNVSDARALTTECRCWGSSEIDGGRWPDGPLYFVTLATYFFAPLCAGSWYALIAQ